MSQSSSKTPPPDLPAAALYGSSREYLMRMDGMYRSPVCTLVLLYIHELRAAYHDDGQMLIALAKIEVPVAQTLISLQSPAPVTSRFVAPPLP